MVLHYFDQQILAIVSGDPSYACSHLSAVGLKSSALCWERMHLLMMLHFGQMFPAGVPGEVTTFQNYRSILC